MDRRTFLKGAVGGAGLVAAGAGTARANLVNLVLPTLGIETRPARTPVEHLVVVMQENRSADHFLGWYGAENPNFDGIQDATFPDLRAGHEGQTIATENWGRGGRDNYHGRGFEDPSHSWSGGRAERAGGALNGWLDPDTGNDELCVATYDPVDVPIWAQLARGYQAYDHWHCSLLGPTQPNRYHMHSAQSGGMKNNTLPFEMGKDRPEWMLGFDWPTIWTLCEHYGVTANYYFSNLPELALWGPRHLTHLRPVAEFYVDALAGTLPQLSFVDPWFSVPAGLANDDHPLADIRLGQAFLSDIIEAFTIGPCYSKGAMVVTYDEWGGFWDHVAPPRIADDRGTPDDPGGDDDFGQLGFRIPSTIISPWTRNPRHAAIADGAVDHTVYEHASVIKFVADNWGLPYLNTRHQATNSIESAFRGFQTYDADPVLVPYDAPLYVFLEPTLEQAGLDIVGDVLAPISDVLGAVPLPISLSGPLSGPTSDLFRLAESGFLDDLNINLDQRFEDSFMHARPELLADATAGLQRLANGAAGVVTDALQQLGGLPGQ